MKKRFLASTLAILMATGALATSASAATPYDPEGFVDPATVDQTTTGAGSASATVEGEIRLGSLIVQVPSAFNYVLNPYGLDVEIDDPDDDGDETITVQDQFLTKAGYMANKGDFDVDISIGMLAAPSAGSGLELIDLDATFAAKKVQAKLGLEIVGGGEMFNLAEATEGSLNDLADGVVVGNNDPEFTFTGAIDDENVIAATIKQRVQPEEAADTNYAAASTKTVMLGKKTVTKVGADGETVAAAAEDVKGTRSTYAAVGLKMAADINGNADWKAADKFDAIVVWDIERHFTS